MIGLAARSARALGGAAALLLSSCGSDGAVNPCPTGDCNLRGSTIVKWRFDDYPDWKFQGDTCIDLNVAAVHVEVVNVVDATIADAQDAPCGDGQATFLGLPDGVYQVAVTPLDADSNPVVRTPGTGQVAAGVTGTNTETTVNVPYTAWTAAFTGTFLFRLSWAGVSCDLATPAVKTQTLTLLSVGQPVTKVSDNGQKLDGTDPKPCRALTEQFAQYVELLPFGPVTLVVVGKDHSDTKRFEHRFDTFVGAGKNNPTITFDVPPPDAPPASI